MVRRIASAASLAALFVSLPSAAQNPTAATPAPTPVPFERASPWRDWCVAPACTPAAGASARAAVVSAPKPVVSSEESGALELAAKERILAELHALPGKAAGPWDTAPLRDLTSTVLAVVAQDEAALARTGGVPASLLRATLTLAVDKALPQALDCDPRARLDAVYEGLAGSVALSSLPFPEKGKALAVACQPVARRAQEMVDGLVARSLMTADITGALTKTASATDAAGKACEGAASKPELTAETQAYLKTLVQAAKEPTKVTVADAQRLVEGAKKANADVTAHRAEAGDGCAQAVDALDALASGPDGGALAKSAQEGFAGAPAKSLADALGAPPPACEGAACAARDLVVRVVSGLRTGLTKDDYVAALRYLASILGIPASEGSLQAEILHRAEDALVVDRDGGATVDQGAFARGLASAYAPGAGLLTSPFVFDVSAGVPSLSTGDTRIVGDATIGYQGASFGVVGRGAVNYFDLTSGAVATDNLRALGALDGFWLSGSEQNPLRFETRLSTGIDYFDTTTIASPSTSRFRFGDYDSLLVRGLLQAGIRWRAAETLRLGVLVGGGAQFERYQTTSLDSRGIQLDAPSSMSGRALGKLTVRWAIAPRYLALRAQGGGGLLSVTRETAVTTSRAGVTTTTITATSETQLDAEARGFVDFDVVKVAGFVPALWGGVNVFVLDSGSNTVPAAGIAIFRPND